MSQMVALPLVGVAASRLCGGGGIPEGPVGLQTQKSPALAQWAQRVLHGA